MSAVVGVKTRNHETISGEDVGMDHICPIFPHRDSAESCSEAAGELEMLGKLPKDKAGPGRRAQD